MTIAKGRPWGHQGALEDGRPVATSDAELARFVSAAVLAGGPTGSVGLAGGDLYATLGGGSASRHPTDPDAWRYPLDAMVVRSRTDGTAAGPTVAVAHVVAFEVPEARRFPKRFGGAVTRRRETSALRRAPWFVEETLVVANAAFVGDWNIAPRGHPNDGRLEVTRGRLAARDRRQLRGRLVTGTHLPHPGLITSRPKAVSSGPGPWHLFVDGIDLGTVGEFDVEARPDAFTAVM